MIAQMDPLTRILVLTRVTIEVAMLALIALLSLDGSGVIRVF